MNSYESWRYPSPSISPRTDKNSDILTQSHQDWLDPSPDLGSISQGNIHGAEQYMTSTRTGAPGSATSAGQGHSGISWPSQRAVSQAQPGSDLRGSFLDQFNSTSLEEPSQNWGAMAGQDIPAVQMQTPPPTRDTNTRRKPVQPHIRFTTPSTTGPRRKSTSAGSVLKRSADHAPLDVSPLHFSPIQFSPADTALFHSGGAATAPAHAHGNIFWDPNHGTELDLPFSSVQEDPFGSLMFGEEIPPFTQSSPIRSKAPAANPRHLRPKNRNASDQTTRPQSARPARSSESRSDRPATFFPTSGVDPNVLWSSNLDAGDRLKISEAAPRGQSHGEAPYQFHFDERRREKEDRQVRASMQQQRRASHGYGGLSNGSQGLRRSVTDSKARRTHGSARSSINSASDLGDITAGLQNAHIPRESSPLKRQRTNQHPLPASQSQSRRTVVLTVDEKGRAKTVVKPVQGGPASSGSVQSNPGEGSSNPPSLPSSTSHSRHESMMDEVPDSPVESPARSNAQEALWQMRRERQQRRKGSHDPRPLDQEF